MLYKFFRILTAYYDFDDGLWMISLWIIVYYYYLFYTDGKLGDFLRISSFSFLQVHFWTNEYN